MRGAFGALIAAAAMAAAGFPAAASGAEMYSPVRVEGGVTLEFSGAAAPGCAAAGSCGVSGVAAWTPPAGASLSYERDSGGVSSSLSFGREPADSSSTRVTRVLPGGGAGVCTDAEQRFVSPQNFARGRAEAAVGLRGADLFTSRCAGPRPEDLERALPVRRVALSALRRGGTVIDLRGDAPFAAGGLAGTVRSTLVLRVGRARRNRGVWTSYGPTSKALTATYAVERVTGSVRTDLQATRDPVRCAALDVCGLAGTLTRRVSGRRGRAYLAAYGRSGRRVLRAALGPGPAAGRRSRGQVDAYGYGWWRTAGGSLTADLARPGGAPPCRDRLALREADLTLELRGGRLVGSYEQYDTRTRCPGPLPTTLGARALAATGSVPARALRRRRVVLRLTRGGRAETGDFRLVSRPGVTIVLRRIR